MALTPQMRQSIHILQLPLLELKTYLEEQVEENPLLEYEQATDEEINKLIKLNSEVSRDSADYFNNTGAASDETQEKQNYLETLIVKAPTLQEYLLKQLGLQPINELDYKIGELIIGNIDENGYFQGSVDEVAQTLKVTPQEAENVLSLIQTFEPQGVGARNLKECLLLQLKFQGKENSLAYQLVESYLTDLAKNKTELIAKSLRVPLESVRNALKEISQLEPKPGRSFGQTEARRIVPDIIVEEIEGNYEIMINNRQLPSLRVSSQYKELLGSKDTPQDTRAYLKEKLNSALWLFKAISQRQETVRRVAECIVQAQREFFEFGCGYLKPLTMKQVAQMIGRDASTVSRAVNNKYMQTPYGVFELSYFFSNSFKTRQEEALSQDALKLRIATLIEEENPRHPLSDDKIVSLLGAQGISVARRTVAKYRKKLKILPTYLRKK